MQHVTVMWDSQVCRATWQITPSIAFACKCSACPGTS